MLYVKSESIWDDISPILEASCHVYLREEKIWRRSWNLLWVRTHAHVLHIIDSIYLFENSVVKGGVIVLFVVGLVFVDIIVIIKAVLKPRPAVWLSWSSTWFATRTGTLLSVRRTGTATFTLEMIGINIIVTAFTVIIVTIIIMIMILKNSLLGLSWPVTFLHSTLRFWVPGPQVALHCGTKIILVMMITFRFIKRRKGLPAGWFQRNFLQTLETVRAEICLEKLYT